MIWKGIRSKKWEFEKKFSGECSAYVSNPARGWYGIYTFQAEKKIHPEELKWSLRKEETLVLVLVDVGGFQERPLDPETLENIRKILRFFEENQRDVIFRPVYDREGKGREREPASFELVLEHLGQLGALLKENPYSVFVFQGFLVGSWGEMHDSVYLSEDCLKRMWERLQPNLGKMIYGAVRTPAQWRTLVSEEEFETGSFPKLGLFDDGIFGSGTHLGTFGTMMGEAAGWNTSWIREEELAFLKTMGKGLPIGGEAVFPDCTGVAETVGCDREKVTAELKKMHLTYLNRAYDQRLLDIWEEESLSGSGSWAGKSLLDYVGAHLGYRFVLQNVELEKSFGSRKLRFLFEIENCGFGGFFQEAELFLILKAGEKSEKFPIPVDFSAWTGGEKRKLELRFEPQEAEIFLELRRKKDGAFIRFANEESADRLYLGSLRFQRD